MCYAPFGDVLAHKMPRHLLTRVTRANQVTCTIAVSLADMALDTEGPKWVQVTREGNFPGYLGGLRPFAFTRVDLDAMVSNIKNHQSFVAGANGGDATGRVIPWDYNHASEQDPTTGSLPSTGAPSQGWTLDMEVRVSTAGVAELWALTHFNEVARAQVKAGQYLWASVAVAFNAVHPETGQNVGAIVTSIALTNTPFVEGMETLVASQRRGPQARAVEARHMYFEAARDVGQAIDMMREMFGLTETQGAAEVMTQIATVRSWLESGSAPIGTNPEELIGGMRIILNLPTLTAQLDVLDAAATSIQALLAEQAASAGVPATPDTQQADGMVPVPPADMMAAARQRDEDDMDELLKALAAKLGVRVNESTILEEVARLAGLRESLALAFGCRDGADVILEAAKKGIDAKTKIAALLGALGVEDVDGAMTKITDTLEAAAKLTEAMPELEGLRTEKTERDTADQETDVDTAIAASKGAIPASMRNTMLLHRKSNPTQFAEDYPKPTVTAAKGGTAPAVIHSHLLTRVAAGTVVAPTQATPAPAGGEVINLANYTGRNVAARAKAYLASKNANWASMSNEEQTKAARLLRKRDDVVDSLAN